MLFFRSLSGFLLFVLSGGIGLAQALSFLPPANASVSGISAGAGMCGSCIAIADFNGDGIPDIAYAYHEFTPFSGVVLGNGDGTFRPGVVFAVFQNAEGFPNAFLTGDFNGDGKADLVYWGTFGPNWIALGNGDGTFQAQIGVTGCASLVAVADVNRDGKADLICRTSVLLSNGDGTFRSGITVDPNPMDEGVLLTADFNHDGNPDLLLERLSTQLAVLLGHGDGTFGVELPVSTILTKPIAGDFNGDGRIDLVGLCTRAGLICTLPGVGDGTFGTATMTSVDSSLPGYFSAAADFNRDGKLDLVAGNAVFAGNGDGTFRLPVFFGPVTQVCGAANDPSFPSFDPCGYATLAAMVSDFNGDGLPDIAAGSVVQDAQNRSNSVIGVLLNDSPGDGFLTPGVSSASLTWPVAAGSIVSAFGVNLAPGTETASTDSPPTTLAGIRVHVRDLSTGDRLAPLLYVSPTQINYIMPSSDPYPWVGLERVGTPYVPKGVAVPVSAVAAGFYSVGQGLAAASALSVAPSGAETSIPVTSCSGTNCRAVPIDLSGAPVYLSLYGTGFDAASAALSTCTIAGETLPVSYAGPQLQVAGLDQVNMLLPKTLARVGDTSVTCLFESSAGVFSATNAVNSTIGVNPAQRR